MGGGKGDGKGSELLRTEGRIDNDRQKSKAKRGNRRMKQGERWERGRK